MKDKKEKHSKLFTTIMVIAILGIIGVAILFG